MTVITVRVDDETRRMMKEIKINWSEFIREAITRKIEEEKRKNIAKAVLINEKLRRRSKGEPSAEKIIRMFREARYTASSD
jgi:Arc/MetJ-type ribon-helix-helix transcriptional regulator